MILGNWATYDDADLNGAGFGLVGSKRRPINGRQSPKDAIIAVQCRLAELGYDPGAITGEVNFQTRAALKRFQINWNEVNAEDPIVVDGAYGTQTTVRLLGPDAPMVGGGRAWPSDCAQVSPPVKAALVPAAAPVPAPATTLVAQTAVSPPATNPFSLLRRYWYVPAGLAVALFLLRRAR